MMMLYHILGTLLFAAALPFLPLVWLGSEKRRANLLQRLGIFTGIPEKRAGTFRIWVHALSVGEVSSALPLVQGLRRRRPEAEIIFTASTRTGYQTAWRLMTPGENGGGMVDVIGYFPFDLWFAVRRVLARIEPDLVVLVETDLWPGVVNMVARREIPLVLANARLSSGAHQGYRRFSFMARPMFAGLAHIMAQTGNDASRFRDVGAEPECISVVGNIKFDQPPPDLGTDGIEAAQTDLGIHPGQRAWIAGSTHEGEESMVIEAFGKLRELDPNLKLIVAPRNPDRSAGLAREFGRGRYRTSCLSDSGPEKEGADILFIDALGVLLPAYAAGSFAFVGGSLVDEGGHNPLEPSMFGMPVVFGPHMEDFQEVARMLIRAGGAEQVDSAEGLAAWAGDLLRDRDRAETMGRAAKETFYSNSGAVERTIDIMEARGFV